ncbi:putative inorganic phosphate cotransporter isoform X3 [Contarinia nasturtii]|uniref:putative inorganic phosphate cotransporter isoform X3 n=1 Tax=Contarinia nasturtii TaxID=265458 RepID=UPI0012D403BB|nr:putative inorganic phosphate cotransporter isoform X3 [Contarinia nasturtii]
MVRNRRYESCASSIFGVRHLQALLLFLGLTLAYAMRVNLSVAIVAITDKHAANPEFEDHDWDEKTKALVLSSFFWGYVWSQVPAGQLAQRIGAKRILLWSMLLCSALTMLTPLSIKYGDWQLLCALRLVEGLCQGVIFPSTHTLLSKWAPVSERAQLATYCYSGSQFGTVVMLSTSGILASSFMGWPSIFYISGLLSGLWAILWLFFGSNSPADYKYISAEERDFIQSSLGHTESDPEHDEKKHRKTPWGDIFTSLPFYSLAIVHAAHNWGFWTLLTEMPSYMKGVLKFDIKKNALLSALPYLAMLLLSYFFSFLSGILERRNCLPLKYSRKVFNTIGHWVPMCALIALGYVSSTEKDLAIFLLVIAVGINSSTYLGFQVNHIDIAPNFAGTLMGLTNAAANVMSIIAPLLVGFIVKDDTDPVEWRLVFFISAGVYFFGNLMFVLFSSTEIQVWNDPEHRDRQIQANKHRRRSSCLEAQGGF